MYTNYTFTSDGELTRVVGIKRNLSNNAIPLDTYSKLDDLKLTAAQNKVGFVLDLVEADKIFYDDFPIEENSVVSSLMYSKAGVYGIINKKNSTATTRRDDNTLRFEDSVDGHIATLHAMLRVLFSNIPPNETILGHSHNLFTTMLYILITKIFNKDYGLTRRDDMEEEELAAIRYACACITGKKLFELNCSINDVAVPLTTMVFNRVRSSYYVTSNNITTYESFATYLAEKTILKNITRSELINGILRQLGHRALLILDCGIDFILDCLFCKTSNNIIAHNIFKNLSRQQYDNLQRKIIQTYVQQVQLNINA